MRVATSLPTCVLPVGVPRVCRVNSQQCAARPAPRPGAAPPTCACRLQGDATPSSPAEFEALLRASPNASYVWIRYMSFLVELGEVDKARAVAQRALQTIYYRWPSMHVCLFVRACRAVHARPMDALHSRLPPE